MRVVVGVLIVAFALRVNPAISIVIGASFAPKKLGTIRTTTRKLEYFLPITFKLRTNDNHKYDIGVARIYDWGLGFSIPNDNRFVL